MVSNEVRDKRRSICNECPFKRDSFKLFGITIFKHEPQCKKCKCLINKKTLFEFAKCPEGKWEK